MRWIFSSFVLFCACSSSVSGGGGGVFVKDSGGNGGEIASSGDVTGTSDGASSDSQTGDIPTSDVQNGEDSSEDILAPDGFFDDPDASKDSGGSADGGGNVMGGCSERAKLMYLVGSDNVLLSFEPDTLKLTTIGTLNCKAQFGATPFSMAVDRNANAWVLFWNGSAGTGIYKVSTLDASCTATSYSGSDVFGMGFTASSPYAQTETLYVGAGSGTGFFNGYNELDTIDFPGMNMNVGPKLDYAGGVELSGNGLGELYGFFDTGPTPSVRQIDPLTGNTGSKVWPLPSKSFGGGMGAMAFSQWGGQFYLSYQGPMDFSTNIWELDAVSGNAKIVKPSIGHQIVGAGVSSCAPTGKKP